MTRKIRKMNKNALADGNFVFRHKRSPWKQVIHKGFVLEFALEISGVAYAIPRLYADEGCLLVVRTPEGDDRRVKIYRHLRFARFVEQLRLVQLTLVYLNRIVAPRIVRKFHHAILSLDERHFVHLVRAVQVTMQGVQRLTVIQRES